MADSQPSAVVGAMATPTALSPGDARLREVLKRYSNATFESARVFRQTGNPRYLPAILRGILEQFVSDDLRHRLATSEDLRLAEDLGIDSLTLMEIAIAAEDAVGFRLEVEEIKHLLTVGEIERVLAAKATLAQVPLTPGPNPASFGHANGAGRVSLP